jgi:hypothetical protein
MIDQPTKISATKARSGSTGNNMRWVLVISMILAVAALLLLATDFTIDPDDKAPNSVEATSPQ